MNTSFRFLNLEELRALYGEKWRIEFRKKYPTSTGMYALKMLNSCRGHALFDRTISDVVKSIIKLAPEIIKPIDEEYVKTCQREMNFSKYLSIHCAVGSGTPKIVSIKGNALFGMDSTPTGNCQMGSIYCFNQFFMYTDPIHGKYSEEETEAIFRRASSRPLLMYDIKSELMTYVKGFDLYTEPTRYISTNGSDMTMGLISIRSMSISMLPSLDENNFAK